MDEAKLQLLVDRSEISDLISRFATALDLHDWHLFRSCFTDEIEADYSEFRGEASGRVKADDFVTQRRVALSDIKTQHVSTNHVIIINDDNASCTSSAVIFRFSRSHKEPENTFDTHASYVHTLTRTSQGWKICGIKQTVLWSRGNELIHGFHRERRGRDHAEASDE